LTALAGAASIRWPECSNREAISRSPKQPSDLARNSRRQDCECNREFRQVGALAPLSVTKAIVTLSVAVSYASSAPRLVPLS